MNAKTWIDDAYLLAGAGSEPHAAALAVLALDEVSKSYLWAVSSVLPDHDQSRRICGKAVWDHGFRLAAGAMLCIGDVNEFEQDLAVKGYAAITLDDVQDLDDSINTLMRRNELLYVDYVPPLGFVTSSEILRRVGERGVDRILFQVRHVVQLVEKFIEEIKFAPDVVRSRFDGYGRVM